MKDKKNMCRFTNCRFYKYSRYNIHCRGGWLRQMRIIVGFYRLYIFVYFFVKLLAVREPLELWDMGLILKGWGRACALFRLTLYFGILIFKFYTQILETVLIFNLY